MYCHPSYAHKTPIIARPTPDTSDVKLMSAGIGEGFPENPRPSRIKTALISNIAATFITVVQSCRFALFLVPRTFTMVTTRIIATAANFAVIADSGTILLRYLLKATASVATDPLLITKNRVQ